MRQDRARGGAETSKGEAFAKSAEPWGQGIRNTVRSAVSATLELRSVIFEVRTVKRNAVMELLVENRQTKKQKSRITATTTTTKTIARQVPEEIPFNPQNDEDQDLEILLDVADRFQLEIKKIDVVFGTYIISRNTKTFREQEKPNFWRPGNFLFLKRFLNNRSPEYRRMFHRLQAEVYKMKST